MKKAIGLILVVWHMLLLDLATKQIAVAFFKGERPFCISESFFHLAYVENRGSAWGMFQGHVWPLAAFAVVAFACLVRWRKSIFYVSSKPSHRKIGFFTECLIYAGIFGNLIDRIFRGYVVDFFDFHWYDSWHFPCFNIADIYITCAAGLLILLTILEPSAKKVDNMGAKS